MNKTIGILIGLSALFTALFYVLARREFAVNLTKDTPFLRRKFLIAVAVLIAFLSGGKMPASAEKLDSRVAPANVKEGQKMADIEKTPEWLELKTIWSSLKVYRTSPPEKIKSEFDSQKENSKKQLAALAKKGYLPQNVALIINYVYGQLLSNRYRSASSVTCYEMSSLAGALMETEQDMENRLELLADISQKGEVKKEVLEEAQNTIAREIEFMRRAKKHFDKHLKPSDKMYWQEEEALVKLYKFEDNVKIDGSVKAEADVSKAAALIVKLNTK